MKFVFGAVCVITNELIDSWGKTADPLREVHLAKTFHIFAYLKHHNTSTMVFNDTLPHVDDILMRHPSTLQIGVSSIMMPLS